MPRSSSTTAFRKCTWTLRRSMRRPASNKAPHSSHCRGAGARNSSMENQDDRKRALRIVRSRHPVQIATGVLVSIFLLSFILSIADNENMQWPMVGHYLLDKHVLSGVRVTLLVTVICQVLAIAIGTA